MYVMNVALTSFITLNTRAYLSHTSNMWDPFVRVPRINYLISHQLTDENKHIHRLHRTNDTARRTHCPVSAKAYLIPTLKPPVHALQDLVCAIFVHPSRFAVTLNCLHAYWQASVVRHVPQHLTGTLNGSVASTFVFLPNFQINCVKVFALLWCYAALLES